jgi:hypothetical protein
MDDLGIPTQSDCDMDAFVTLMVLTLDQHRCLGQFAMRFRSSSRNSAVQNPSSDARQRCRPANVQIYRHSHREFKRAKRFLTQQNNRQGMERRQAYPCGSSRYDPPPASRTTGRSVGYDHVRATVEKVKHPARKKFFTPSRTRSCAILGRPARTEFRHDSCNTEQG